MTTQSSKAIHVAVFGLRGMLGEITEATLTGAPDIELVGRPESAASLEGMVREGGADVVILGSQSCELPALGRDLLMANASVRVLIICDDGRESFLYELRPFEVPLGEVSPQGLLDAVRTAGERTR